MVGAEDIETGALIISVTRRELRELVQTIREMVPARLDIRAAPNGPSLRGITKIYQEGGGDRVTVRVEGGAAWVLGNRAAREILARRLEAFGEYNDLDEPGMHTHFDPERPGAEAAVLTSASVPLIVTGPVPDLPSW